MLVDCPIRFRGVDAQPRNSTPADCRRSGEALNFDDPDERLDGGLPGCRSATGNVGSTDLHTVKVLFLADNFPPETNAPATRTFEHARQWVADGHEVTIVTSAPNFPRGVVFEGYRNRLFQRETLEGIEVVRVWTYMAPNEGFLKRTLDYLSFMTSSVLASFAIRRPDVVIGTSPQFFTVVGAWLVAKLKRRPFVFELRDLWPESIVAVNAIRNPRLIRWLQGVAGFLYRQADLIVPVTQPFADHLRELGIPDSRIHVVVNGLDPDLLGVQSSTSETRERFGLPRDAFIAAYVGTLGMAHGLTSVLDAAEKLRADPGIHFLLVGDGAGKQRLEERVERSKMRNVTILDRQPRRDALALLEASDVSIVALKDDPVFRTVIPSKIFESMGKGRPILLGVQGEAHRIVIEEAGCGLAYTPESPTELVAALEHLRDDPDLRESLGKRGLQVVAQQYNRTDLARSFVDRLLRLTGGR